MNQISNVSQSVRSLGSATMRPISEQCKLYEMTSERRMLRDKFSEVTSVSPRSRYRMREVSKAQFSELIDPKVGAAATAGMGQIPATSNSMHTGRSGAVQITQQSSNSDRQSNSTWQEQPKNLRVTTALAEYAYEDLTEKEVKISEEEYAEFKKKYHRMVFDKKGNYLYTKLDPKSSEQHRTVLEIYQSKNTSAKLKRDLNDRSKGYKPEKIVGDLVKNSQEEATMHPRKKAILLVKERVMKSLNSMLQQEVKQKIIDAAQEEVVKASLEMTSEVEKLVRENEVLRRDLEKLKDMIVELQTQNENASWKNSCLVKDIGSITGDFDLLKSNSRELEGFIPQYKILLNRFPGLDANQLIFKYEKLEDHCLELSKKIAEQEEQMTAIDAEKVKIRVDFDQQADALMLKDSQREKQMRVYLDRLREKESEIKDAEEYKKNYMQLQKKIQKIFIDWNSQIKVYPLDRRDEGPRAEVKDPMEFLDIMEREVKISTPDKLQEYLRKIIVSANLLQRKYLPEFVNDKFDPDKIYERILKLVDKLDAENFKLKVENKQLRRSDPLAVHDQITNTAQVASITAATNDRTNARQEQVVYAQSSFLLDRSLIKTDF